MKVYLMVNSNDKKLSIPIFKINTSLFLLKIFDYENFRRQDNRMGRDQGKNI